MSPNSPNGNDIFSEKVQIHITKQSGHSFYFPRLFYFLFFLRRKVVTSPEMTKYGTIPTSSEPSQPSYVRARERIMSSFAERRPWKLMIDIHSIRLPSSYSEAVGRFRTNISFFRVNYAIVALLIIYFSLLWHPISLIVFSVMALLWVFFYFLRDEPLTIFGRTIDDRIVLISLSVFTLVFLFLTSATANILFALLIAAAVVVLHAVLRKTDDLFNDEEGAGLMPGVGYRLGSSPSS